MIKIRNNVSVKLLIALFVCMFVLSITKVIYAKYIFQEEFDFVTLDIDRTKPKIEVIGVENSNTGYEKFANKTHTIKINIKIIEKNLKGVFLDNDFVKIKLNEEYIKYENIKSKKLQDVENGAIYQIELNNIDGNGNLKVDLLEGTIVDDGNLENDFFEINTNIVIDNIIPNGKMIENVISNGKENAIINFSEGVKEIEGWKFSEEKLKAEKEFTNNISYELPIEDYAGNKSIVKIDITKATYINMIYASHNSEVGWSFGYGNYDIAGKNAIKRSPILKTEALAFNITGNIEPDFVQAKAYVHTHWGEGSLARCGTSNMLYNYGYNPIGEQFKSMKSNDLITIDNKQYFQFGGSGINQYLRTDINGNYPIPYDVACQYRYGISGINFKLKNYSQFSIVYQILVDEYGWIKTCSDGQECMYNKAKPMSAFRIALVPKSEKKHVIDTWNKDVGTFKLQFS